jgi:hypothetical protein
MLIIFQYCFHLFKKLLCVLNLFVILHVEKYMAIKYF